MRNLLLISLSSVFDRHDADERPLLPNARHDSSGTSRNYPRTSASVQDSPRFLPRQGVRRNPIEEPAVVTCDDCTARECKQRFLKARERLGIEIVCWLIEQEEITSLLGV